MNKFIFKLDFALEKALKTEDKKFINLRIKCAMETLEDMYTFCLLEDEEYEELKKDLNNLIK